MVSRRRQSPAAKRMEHPPSSSSGAVDYTGFGLLRPILSPLPVELLIWALHDGSRLYHTIRFRVLEIMLSFEPGQFQLFKQVGFIHACNHSRQR